MLNLDIDTENAAEEAKTVFKNTLMAKDLDSFIV